jgi:Flp pilus assembly protein TadG
VSNMRHRKAKNGERNGVAAAELAILLPFLLLMFGVALDFCRVFYASQTIQNCAYAGSLYASAAVSSRPDVATASAAAQDAALAEAVSLNPALPPGNITTTIANGTATVTVSYDFPLLTSVMGSKTLTITRTVSMATVPQGPFWGPSR